ncbi:MAG: DUF1326 domain-containing protein [Chloroflexi bacterium]|nr:DUF1326 domain-containing protein [Chloroflexota bacterium]
MSTAEWQVSGQYFETCSCDFLCPCISSNLTARPTHGACTAALAFHVDRGHFGTVSLDGLNFVVVLRTPGAMADGNWSVGVITDERGTAGQQQALVSIASGQAGGPMAALGPLVGTFLGTESGAIALAQIDGHWSLSVPSRVTQAARVVNGLKADEPIYLDNTIHPVNTRLALATAESSHVHAFGLDWDDDSGRNNGHFAPFTWQSS